MRRKSDILTVCDSSSRATRAPVSIAVMPICIVVEHPTAHWDTSPSDGLPVAVPEGEVDMGSRRHSAYPPDVPEVRTGRHMLAFVDLNVDDVAIPRPPTIIVVDDYSSVAVTAADEVHCPGRCGQNVAVPAGKVKCVFWIAPVAEATVSMRS